MSVIIGYHVPEPGLELQRGKCTGPYFNEDGDQIGTFTLWFEYYEDSDEIRVREYEPDQAIVDKEDIIAALEREFEYTGKKVILL